MSAFTQPLAQIRESLESYPGGPCSCPKHKHVLDSLAALDRVERLATAAEEWAYRRRRYIDSICSLESLRDAEVALVRAVLSAREEGADTR